MKACVRLLAPVELPDIAIVRIYYACFFSQAFF